MGQKIIELDNLNKTKLSDIIESVIADIQRVTTIGFKINMYLWCHVDNIDDYCCVCLGGASALGFLSDKQIKDILNAKVRPSTPLDLAEYVNHGKEKEVENMIYMFNSLRSKDFGGVCFYYKNINPKSTLKVSTLKSISAHCINSYSGKLLDSEVEKLCIQYTALSAKLRDAGY